MPEINPSLAGHHLDGRAERGNALIRQWKYVIGWALVILILTSVPGSALQGAPSIPGADKVVHALLYGILGWLTASALVPKHHLRSFTAWIGIVLFAAADEWHQRWIPARSADWADWGTDAVAAAAAIWLFNMASQRRELVA